MGHVVSQKLREGGSPFRGRVGGSWALASSQESHFKRYSSGGFGLLKLLVREKFVGTFGLLGLAGLLFGVLENNSSAMICYCSIWRSWMRPWPLLLGPVWVPVRWALVSCHGRNGQLVRALAWPVCRHGRGEMEMLCGSGAFQTSVPLGGCLGHLAASAVAVSSPEYPLLVWLARCWICSASFKIWGSSSTRCCQFPTAPDVILLRLSTSELFMCSVRLTALPLLSALP